MRRKLFFFPFVKMSYFSYAKFGNKHRILQAGQYRGLGLDASMDVPSIPMAMLRDTIQ